MYHLEKALDLSLKFSVRSIMYKKKRDPRMDPWGTPTLISAHDECSWWFKTIFCFLLVKLSKRDNKSPEKTILA